MTKIRGNNDGPGGRNETYDIGRRKDVPRTQVVQEVEAGKHSGAHVYKRGRQKYVRDNPDASTRDNLVARSSDGEISGRLRPESLSAHSRHQTIATGDAQHLPFEAALDGGETTPERGHEIGVIIVSMTIQPQRAIRAQYSIPIRVFCPYIVVEEGMAHHMK